MEMGVIRSRLHLCPSLDCFIFGLSNRKSNHLTLVHYVARNHSLSNWYSCSYLRREKTIWDSKAFERYTVQMWVWGVFNEKEKIDKHFPN